MYSVKYGIGVQGRGPNRQIGHPQHRATRLKERDMDCWRIARSRAPIPQTHLVRLRRRRFPTRIRRFGRVPGPSSSVSNAHLGLSRKAGSHAPPRPIYSRCCSRLERALRRILRIFRTLRYGEMSFRSPSLSSIARMGQCPSIPRRRRTARHRVMQQKTMQYDAPRCC